MKQGFGSDWTQSRLEQHISDGVEESLSLDYKAAGALAKTDSKRREITKDVSAFANSAGGTIVYGIQEFQSPGMKHLPERIDPISRKEFSKEWLEHVVQSIRPRIEGVLVVPVDLDSGPGDVVYVVEIPASATAHQAQDHRYYRRFNFEAVPMADHEIRDVMNRSRHPRFEVDLAVQRRKYGMLCLELFYHNVGEIYAQYVNGFVSVACELLSGSDGRSVIVQGQECREFGFANLHQDLVQYRAGIPSISTGSGGFVGGTGDERYYVTRYDPILPGLGRSYYVSLGVLEDKIEAHRESVIQWTLYADNARPIVGLTKMGEVQLPNDEGEI